MRLSYEIAPPIGSALSRQTAEADLRYYKRIGGSGLLALRARAFKSWGEAADFMYFGGNSEMRGYEYLEFLGQEVLFMNAELRFPFIEAMLTPIGVMGGIRGVVFANMGGGKFDGQDFKWWSNSPDIYTPIARLHRPAAHPRSTHSCGWLPPGGRACLVWSRSRNLRPRLPDPFRLGVAHALQQGLGGSPLQHQRRSPMVRQAAVNGSAVRSSRCGLDTISSW